MKPTLSDENRQAVDRTLKRLANARIEKIKKVLKINPGEFPVVEQLLRDEAELLRIWMLEPTQSFCIHGCKKEG